MTQIQRVKDCLLQQFHIKDLGDLKYFLGIEFSHSKAGIYMSHRKYAFHIWHGTHMCSSRQIFPIEHYLKLTPDDVIKGSSQIQATRGTTDIPHGYSA